ncbi:MAG: hypothetical protein ABI723_09000 [Bacteroidia bacterium]
MESELKTPLTPMQLELLKLFPRNIQQNEVDELKEVIRDFYIRKIQEVAAKVASEKKYTAIDFDKMLTTHSRTPYK